MPELADELRKRRIQRLISRNRLLSKMLQASESRAEGAERQLKVVKSSVSWRWTRSLRSICNAFKQLSVFFGALSPPIAPDRQNLSPITFANNSRLALIIDFRWPRPDEDSGSIDALNLIEALMAAKFDISFFADTESALISPSRLALESLGVLCLGCPREMDLQPFLREYGDRIQLCILSRVYAGGNYIEDVQKYCPQACIIFNPVDLHFLREERQARLLGEADALAAAAVTRARELLVFREADATIVVSAAEHELLAGLDPGAQIFHLPLARPIVETQASFETRRGIGFVGGFEHSPNLDAVRFFLAEIWPLVRQSLPCCEFLIAGKGLPDELVRNLGPGVHYLGHVPDIAAWLDTLRLTVAPLRFGAGAKGKIASSLACGVPCVATTVAVEGMGLAENGAVLLADTPAAFAERIQLGYTDAALWRQMSKECQTHAREAISVARFRRVVTSMLEAIDLAPPGAQDRND